MKAFILAAGLGTRLKPVTNTKPKALVKMAGKTMLELALEQVVKVGIREIVINSHCFPKLIEDFTANFKQHKPELNIKIIYEKELLETGGAIKNAESLLKDGDNFLVHNVDIVHKIDLNKMIQQFNQDKPLALLACKNKQTTRPWLVDEENYVCGHKNTNTNQEIINRKPKGALREMYFCGAHLISGDIFGFLEEGKYSITPKYLELIKKGLAVKSFNVGDAYHFDLGSQEKIEKAERFLKSLN